MIFLLNFLSGCSTQKPTEGPMVAILCSRSDLIQILDAEELKTANTIPLRSLAMDFILNKDNGLIYTAQCGGVGPDADNRVGEIDARTGSCRYIELKYPNPCDIVVYDNKLFVIHGFMLKSGEFVGSKISVPEDYKVDKFLLPGIPNGNLTTYNQFFFTSLSGKGKQKDQCLAAFDMSIEKTIEIDVESFLGNNKKMPILTTDEGGRVYGFVYDKSILNKKSVNTCRIAVIDPESSKLVRELDASPLKSLRGTLTELIYSQGYLFALFTEGQDTVAVLNAETGEVEKLLSQFSNLSCMMVQGNRLYLGQRREKKIIVLNTTNWDVTKEVPLKGTPQDILFIP